MKTLFFHLVLLSLALTGCQSDEQSPILNGDVKVVGRTDAVSTLQDGVEGVLSLLYSPLSALDSAQIQDLFQSSSRFDQFLEEEEINSVLLNAYIEDIVESREELAQTQTASYISNVVSATTQEFMLENDMIEDEPISMAMPCTTQYIIDMNAASAVAIGCVVMAPEMALGCVGIYIIEAAAALASYHNCIQNTYN